MTIRDLVHLNPGGGPCTCRAVDALRALLEQRTLPPCRLHDPAGHEQAEREAAAEEARAEANPLRQALTEMKAGDELAARRAQRQADLDAREKGLAEVADPMLRTVIAKTGAPIPGLSLNAPPSSYAGLAGMNTASSHHDFDGPDAA